MTAASILIISDQLKSETLINPPFSLDADEFWVTNFESLRYLGLSRFGMVILHEPPSDLLRKLSLGIRDGPKLEALWDIFAKTTLSLKVLVPAPGAPQKVWMELGLEAVYPSDLKNLIKNHQANSFHSFGEKVEAQTIMTADDVRDLYQSGVRNLDENTRLTEWAREVAISLGITFSSQSPHFILIALAATNKASITAASEKVHAWSVEHPNALFVLPPPLLPVFIESYPALKSRTVSSTIHWASSGAFTGEVSMDMLAGLGCIGAVVPDQLPHNAPENCGRLLAEGRKRGFLLFATFPLEPSKVCDIISPLEVGTRPESVPGREQKTADNICLPLSDGSILIRESDFPRLNLRKGMNS